jgi:hypothetical protein
MIARPTTTSAAATTIEKNASTCPPRSLCIRANDTSVRFTAFSWQLDRHEDPQGVPVDQHAHRAQREQDPGEHEEEGDRGPHGRDLDLCFVRQVLAELGLGHRADLPLGQHHRGDRGDDQQDRRRLEREEVVAEEHLGHRLRVARRLQKVEPLGRVGREPDPRAQRGRDLQDEPDREHDRDRSLQPQPFRPHVDPVDAEQHDHEQEQHHDRAGVHDDLHREQERGVEHQVHHRDAPEVHDEEQRGVDDAPGDEHPDRRGDGDRREHPEDDVVERHLDAFLVDRVGAEQRAAPPGASPWSRSHPRAR